MAFFRRWNNSKIRHVMGNHKSREKARDRLKLGTQEVLCAIFTSQGEKPCYSYPKEIPILWATPSHLCLVLALPPSPTPLLFPSLENNSSWCYIMMNSTTSKGVWNNTNNLGRKSLSWPKAFSKPLKPWICQEKAPLCAWGPVPWARMLTCIHNLGYSSINKYCVFRLYSFHNYLLST